MPPEGLTVALPLLPPKQLTLVCALIEAVGVGFTVTVTEEVAEVL